MKKIFCAANFSAKFTAKKGEIFALAHAFLHAFFYVFSRAAAKNFPPIFVAAVVFLAAAFFTFPFFIFDFKKNSRPKFSARDAGNFFAAIFIVIFICHGLIFFALSKNSAGPVAILGQTEIFFTFFLFSFSEKINFHRVAGGTLIFFGALGILFQNFKFSAGAAEAAILLSAILAPFGNFFQKKIVRKFSPISLVFWRNFVGGILFLLASFFFENWNFSAEIFSTENFLFFAIAAICGAFLSKILFLKSIKFIDVSKSIPLAIGPAPALALFFEFLFFHEIPNFWQLGAFFLMIAGIWQIFKK